jgi:hypothetical protein
VNGFLVDVTDISEFASVIERMLDRRQTSDAALQAMGRAMAAEFLGHSYLDELGL